MVEALLATVGAPSLGEVECRRALHALQAHVRAVREQQLHHFRDAVGRGRHQGGAAGLRRLVHLRAQLDERRGRLLVVGPDRVPHGRPSVGVLLVNVGATLREVRDRVGRVPLSRHHELGAAADPDGRVRHFRQAVLLVIVEHGLERVGAEGRRRAASQRALSAEAPDERGRRPEECHREEHGATAVGAGSHGEWRRGEQTQSGLRNGAN
mmetsp:Transcript_50402/g.148731  ORF Transcript_50402/g.148731 Transcript_50402/m.148731 type:complete len:210 (+) Transcript_50402:436-1065(+)